MMTYNQIASGLRGFFDDFLGAVERNEDTLYVKVRVSYQQAAVVIGFLVGLWG